MAENDIKQFWKIFKKSLNRKDDKRIETILGGETIILNGERLYG